MKYYHVMIGLQFALILILTYALRQECNRSSLQAAYGFTNGWQKRGKAEGGIATEDNKSYCNYVEGTFFYEDSKPEGVDVQIGDIVVEGVTHINLYGRLEQ